MGMRAGGRSPFEPRTVLSVTLASVSVEDEVEDEELFFAIGKMMAVLFFFDG